MAIENWEEWMMRNHIKIRSEQSDGRSDAGSSIECVSGAKVAAEMLEHARETSNRDLYELVEEGQARIETQS